LAAIVAESFALPGLKPPLTPAGIAVVPVRPTARNDLRRGLVAYNNEPHTAESPAMHLAQRHDLVDTAALRSQVGVCRFNPYRAGGPQFPALRFGQTYRTAAFVVGIGGMLPDAVADPDDRTCYVAPSPSVIRRWSAWFPYRRRVAGPGLGFSPGEADPDPPGEGSGERQRLRKGARGGNVVGRSSWHPSLRRIPSSESRKLTLPSIVRR
jgi:hypothetical protein